MEKRIYGERVPGLVIKGKAIQAGVFDERQARAAAGITMVLGATALAYAYFARFYIPIQAVTVVFFIDFLLRVTLGLRHSITGGISVLLTRGRAPEWVSAKPKRFAWSLGIAMSLAMVIITNSGIRGPLPLTICLICLALMWMEAVLGLCLGCEIYAFMKRRGWVGDDAEIEVCADGVCNVEAPSR